MNIDNIKTGTLIEVSQRRNHIYRIVPPGGISIVSRVEVSFTNIKKIKIYYYSLEFGFNEFFILDADLLDLLNKDRELNTNLCRFTII